MRESREVWYTKLREGKRLLLLHTRVYSTKPFPNGRQVQKIIGVFADRDKDGNDKIAYLTDDSYRFYADALGKTIFTQRSEAIERYAS